MQHRCFAIGKNRGKRMRAAIAQRRCDQLYVHGYTGCSVTAGNIPAPQPACLLVSYRPLALFARASRTVKDVTRTDLF